MLNNRTIMNPHCSNPECESCSDGLPCGKALCTKCHGDCVDGCDACGSTGYYATQAHLYFQNFGEIFSLTQELINRLKKAEDCLESIKDDSQFPEAKDCRCCIGNKAIAINILNEIRKGVSKKANQTITLVDKSCIE